VVVQILLFALLIALGYKYFCRCMGQLIEKDLADRRAADATEHSSLCRWDAFDQSWICDPLCSADSDEEEEESEEEYAPWR